MPDKRIFARQFAVNSERVRFRYDLEDVRKTNHERQMLCSHQRKVNRAMQNFALRITLDGVNAAKTRNIAPVIMNDKKPKRLDVRKSKMARGNDRRLPDLRFDELSPEKCKGPTTFTIGTDGKIRAHTRPVPEFRMRRARRILWQCKQQPEWARTQAAYFKHPALRNVPYQVLKQLLKESED